MCASVRESERVRACERACVCAWHVCERASERVSKRVRKRACECAWHVFMRACERGCKRECTCVRASVRASERVSALAIERVCASEPARMACVRTADLLACAELLLRRALQRVESAQQEPLSGWWAGGRKLQCLGTLEATPVCILCGNQRTFCSVGRSGRESAARGIGRVGLAWVRESWSGVAHAAPRVHIRSLIYVPRVCPSLAGVGICADARVGVCVCACVLACVCVHVCTWVGPRARPRRC